ncbi:D-alanine--D-alanine ligase [Coxiella endosymbiont of Amblyomma sculptum]|uniref:D-alanine--D-alanine ligase family protein n=1 Tax=Coxiella endosymbiont of Amblyomma sculptum TaxID=2487929 RepID=UPI00132F008D|nr:D-alanine--D-alanine ligase family protein [Coxiella endosymbiont of Amblyomma sculptum]QHG92538.1 D-alanine--D-alanine ligase [Coxiella endosymbiont of Amblyomma sculptum]
MKNKLSVSVLCGGRSVEHEISIQSARNVVVSLNPNKYEVSVVFIDHNGSWYLIDHIENFLTQTPQNLISTRKSAPITVVLGEQIRSWRSLDGKSFYKVDCVFPMIHGTHGEDGILQGFLEVLNLPYVGADIHSSSICIQKDVTKNLLRAEGILVADWYTLWSNDRLEGVYSNLTNQWRTDELFVKAVNLGSSVAACLVRNAIEFQKGAENIFCYDNRLIVEPRIFGREIECAVLGNNNENLQTSLPSEIAFDKYDFYSYKAKYIDSSGVKTTLIVTDLSKEIIRKIRKTAVDAFKVVRCSGMARVDFFLTTQNQIVVNEINTIPGFTDTSMYPKMWESIGLSYSALLDRLIELALERYRDRKKLIFRYDKPSRTHGIEK